MTRTLLALLLCLSLFWANGQVQNNPFNRTYFPAKKSWATGTDQVKIGGETIEYTVEAQYLPLGSEEGATRARVFYTAYTRSEVEDPTQRPITFVFNGGPGSSSVWLHMGGLGPKRVNMNDDGSPVAPPYGYSDNPHSWLDLTDLVFIDPMMTGYTRPAEEADKEDFLGFQQDLELVGQFIQVYLSENKRWGSPKFLAGESYGTTRAAGLSGYLQNRYGLYLNGITLISAVMDFSTLIDVRGNDLAPLTVLPTMAATAWYHGQASEEFESLEDLLKEVEEFVMGDYALALLQGDRLTGELEEKVIDRLHAFTGLDTSYLADVHCRLSVGAFNKELLRSQGVTVGRLDSRFKGVDYQNAGESYDYDPSYNRTIYGPFTAAIYDYLGREIGVEINIPYEILTGRARPWPYGEAASNQYLNVAETLRQAMTHNPDMKVWVASGYYDMATPYFATEYTLDHMFLAEGLRENIMSTYYPAGHMMYIHKPSLEQLKQDAERFYEGAY